MSVVTYDPAQVIVTFGGAVLSGYADGTFVNVQFDESQWNKVTGADGLTQRSKTNNYAGSVTITLLAGSASNDTLSTAWNSDRTDNDGDGALIVKDASGNTLWSASSAWIQGMPAQAFSKQGETREWVIDCGALTGKAGGNS